MGVCLSCLGLSRHSSGAESSDTTRLLDPAANQSHYGANAADGPNYYDLGTKLDPEEEQREREALNAIWKQTSDKLIDVSYIDANTGMPLDYARLFSDAFPRPNTRSRKHRPQSHTNASSHADKQVYDEDESDDEHIDEQTWIRNIIMRDPQDKSWDCNRVHKIGKPLVISFDDSGGGSGRAEESSNGASRRTGKQERLPS